MATPTTSTPLVVYVVSGKRKPVKTDIVLDRDEQLPARVTYLGSTYHLGYVDRVRNTATFVTPPQVWLG